MKPIAINQALRLQIEQQLLKAIADGAVRCSSCQRVFTALNQYTHDYKGRPICFPNCPGGDHDRAA